jgi:hypothetical protein
MRNARLLPALLAALALVGCASRPAERPTTEANKGDEGFDLGQHVLIVDSRGRTEHLANQLLPPSSCPGPLPPASEGLVEQKCGELPPAERLFVRFVREFMSRPDERGLLLYFNGGLNTPQDVIDRSVEQGPRMRDAGYYPLFMAWPTGPTTSYFEQVYQTNNGRYSEERQPLTGSLRFASSLLVGIARAPADWVYNVRRFNDTIGHTTCEFVVADPMLPSVAPAGDAAGCIEPKQASFRAVPDNPGGQVVVSDFVNSGPQDPRRAAELVATTAPRVLLVPLADGFGEAAWKNMKRRTERTIHAEFELEGRDPYWEALRQRYPRGTGGFAQFMALLESCTRGIPADGGPPCPEGVSAEARAKLCHAKLTIIGHSMGAIVVNQLVQAFPDLNYESIVYLSGAATVRDTKAALEPVLRQHGGRTTFYNLMLHPLNEALETHFAGSIPSGSLLVWIDEMLEHPDTRLDRTVGQWSNMQGGRHAFAPDVRARVRLKIFDLAPHEHMLRKAPDDNAPNDDRLVVREHGGYNFKGVPFWDKAFWTTEEGCVVRKGQDHCVDAAPAGQKG